MLSKKGKSVTNREKEKESAISQVRSSFFEFAKKTVGRKNKLLQQEKKVEIKK